MRKLYQAHAVLFVCAYTAFLVYCAPTDFAARLAFLHVLPTAHDALFNAAAPSDAVSATAPSASRGNTNSGNTNSGNTNSGNTNSGSTNSASTSSSNEIAAGIEAASATAALTEAEREAQRTRLTQIGQQAMRAAEPQQRAEAIDQLHVATPETLQALQIAVTSDSTVRNRVRAVNSLRALAEQEGAQQTVLSILHLAMSDANTSVASRATEVYRELTQQPGPNAGPDANASPEPESVAAE